LVQNHRPACLVVPPRSHDELAEIALRDFLTYVEKSTGVRLPVADTPHQDVDSPIVGLRVSHSDEQGRNRDGGKLSRHEFRYQVTPTRMTITGADPGGLAKGVHWFLRQKLGVRWFMPTELGEEVPRHRTVQLKQENTVRSPEFEWVRMTGNPEALPEEVMWGIRHGDDILDADIRNHWFRAHNWSHIISPTQENVQKHPEWFAREEGELPQAGPYLNVDVSNPEVIERFVEVARSYFDTDPRRVMFSIEPNDTQYYGNSRSLKELRKRLGADAISTDEFIWFCNRVAAGLKTTHPDKRLGFYAYGHHMWAPRVVMPDPMLSFMMCRHGGRACTRHSLLDPRNHINAEWRKNFEMWCTQLEHPGYYGYWGEFSWFGPTPLDRLAEDLPYLKRQKVYQTNSENRFSWATNAPYYYLALRLVQDTGLNPAVILDEFCRGMYGRAHEPMRRYWARWSNAWDAAPPRDRTGYRHESTFPPTLIQAAREDLDKARQLVSDQPKRFQSRVRLAQTGLVFTDSYLRMYRQAAAGEYAAAIATGEEVEQIILDAAESGRPAPFARHPSAEKSQMALDRLRADLSRYRSELSKSR
jgi:hypothetical protein